MLLGEFVLGFILAFVGVIRVFFRGRSATALEVPALRQQVAVLKRKRPRFPLNSFDRLFWATLRNFWTRGRDVLVIVKPATVVGWHRAGFRLYWRWRSRRPSGRPKITEVIRSRGHPSLLPAPTFLWVSHQLRRHRFEAWDFIKLRKAQCSGCGHDLAGGQKWSIYFLMATGVWNFVGAGIFGSLINLPIVSYFDVSTALTPNHGHAALYRRGHPTRVFDIKDSDRLRGC